MTLGSLRNKPFEKTLLLFLTTILMWGTMAFSQSAILIDGNFDDWAKLPVLITDSPNDEHDTDWFGNGLPQPIPRKYSDVDILEVKFTHDRENLYGYVKATGVVGRTSRKLDGHNDGRYYYIITIDVDNNDTTGYPLQEGNYWPNSTGYDMNMEVEFYDGAFNTGHYINHEFLSADELEAGRIDLYNYIIRLRPGTYKHYLQWVVFPDSLIVEVKDRGPVFKGIIEVAVSPDGHEAEMKAPMWGFFSDEKGVPIVKLGNTIDISFSLEGSGELSESAIEMGHSGKKAVWGSDTADPIVGYYLKDVWTGVEQQNVALPSEYVLNQNYPNPFNSSTTLDYQLSTRGNVNLAIYNIQGRKIAVLVNEFKNAGKHQVVWDGRTQAGFELSSGVYVAVLEVAGIKSIRRMLFLR